MKKEIRTGPHQKKNTGSTLITVLAAVSFLMILATMILSTSMANLQMKQMEYAVKKNFYTDEQVLDDIYNGIGKVSTDCLSRAYARILSQAADDKGTAVFTTQDAAYQAFSRLFMELLREASKYPECINGDTAYDVVLDKLRSYTTAGSGAEVVEFQKTEILPAGSMDGSITAMPEQYIFRDVVVRYKDARTGVESTITTDIVIDIPYINFFQDSSVILDYALIGNKGIYFSGSGKSADERKVEGNIYAGIPAISETRDAAIEKLYRNDSVYGGLNFYQSNAKLYGNYIISKGDINVRDSDVTIQNAGMSGNSQIWAESIRTVEDLNKNTAPESPRLKIIGNIYAANDLELNARESEVTLEGEYYGYNNGIYVTQEKKSTEAAGGVSYETAAHTQSSAIIINGNQSRLDISGLKTLVVAGMAYVDLRSQAYIKDPVYPGGNAAGKIEEYQTGESLALKSNQYMYLAPASCLYTGNPVKTGEKPAEVWSADSKWFGVEKGFVNPDNPIIEKVVFNRTTNESYTYFYLNFMSGKQTEYANLVLNMKNPETEVIDPEINARLDYDRFDEIQKGQIWTIKKEIEAMAANPGTRSEVIYIANDTQASIYTQGAIAQVTAGTLSGVLPAQISALSLEYITKIENNLLKHYKYLYAELDPKEDFSLTSDALPDIATDTLEAASPASKYIDFSGMINSTVKSNYKCDKSYSTYLGIGTLTVSDSNFKGIILCDGDIVIKGGSNIEGMVAASGKITVEGGGTIKANRSVVQAILDEEAAEEAKKESEAEKNMAYAVSYLKEYKPNYGGTDNAKKVSGTDYTDYISYQNWRKG